MYKERQLKEWKNNNKKLILFYFNYKFYIKFDTIIRDIIYLNYIKTNDT